MGLFRTSWQVSGITLLFILVFIYAIFPNTDSQRALSSSNVDPNSRLLVDGTSIDIIKRMFYIFLYMLCNTLLYPAIGVLFISGIIDIILTIKKR